MEQKQEVREKLIEEMEVLLDSLYETTDELIRLMRRAKQELPDGKSIAGRAEAYWLGYLRGWAEGDKVCMYDPQDTLDELTEGEEENTK